MEPTPNKKRILYIITKSNFGGAQKYVYDLSCRLQNEYDITVAFGGDGELKQKLEAKKINTLTIINLSRDINIWNEFKVFFELIRIFREARPEIVHLNSSKIGGLGVLAVSIFNLFSKLTSNNLRIKAIFTAHGWVFNEDRNFISKRVAKLLHEITILLSDKTIAVSNCMAYQVASFPRIQNKISVIYNGLQKTTPLGKNISQEYLISLNQRLSEVFANDPGKRKKTLWIGTISELHDNKGLEFMINALSLFKKDYPSFIFIIMGEGEKRKNLEALIKQKELERNVFLLGNIPDAARYLKALNIFTLTSLTEALPYALLEAGMAQLPVIASSVGGIPEIIEQLESGILVRPRNPEEIKEAIIFLLENKSKRREISENLNKKVKTEFSLEKMIAETRKIYDEMTNS